jgi:hypothetical protein
MQLSQEMIDRIARSGGDAFRKSGAGSAWEVVPELAELLLKKRRLEEMESKSSNYKIDFAEWSR